MSAFELVPSDHKYRLTTRFALTTNRRDMEPTNFKTPDEVLELWAKNIGRVQSANHEAANQFNRIHISLGIPTILITGFVGAAAVTKWLEGYPSIILVVMSVLATALTSLQAFLNVGDRAAKHAQAANEYGCLKRRIQEFRSFRPEEEGALRAFMEEIRGRFDDLSRATPQIPTGVWKKALKAFPPSNMAGKLPMPTL